MKPERLTDTVPSCDWSISYQSSFRRWYGIRDFRPLLCYLLPFLNLECRVLSLHLIDKKTDIQGVPLRYSGLSSSRTPSSSTRISNRVSRYYTYLRIPGTSCRKGLSRLKSLNPISFHKVLPLVDTLSTLHLNQTDVSFK